MWVNKPSSLLLNYKDMNSISYQLKPRYLLRIAPSCFLLFFSICCIVQESRPTSGTMFYRLYLFKIIIIVNVLSSSILHDGYLFISRWSLLTQACIYTRSKTCEGRCYLRIFYKRCYLFICVVCFFYDLLIATNFSLFSKTLFSNGNLCFI